MGCIRLCPMTLVLLRGIAGNRVIWRCAPDVDLGPPLTAEISRDLLAYRRRIACDDRGVKLTSMYCCGLTRAWKKP